MSKPMKVYKDRWPLAISGYLFIILVIGVIAYLGFNILETGVSMNNLPLLLDRFGVAGIGGTVAAVILLFLSLSGFYTVQPNTARVLTFLGNYVGTDRRTGLRWTLPVLIARTEVSQRLNNFESSRSKVNDATGNPIEIAGIVVWRVVSPASSVFGVNFVGDYVATQSDAAIRAIASRFPYGSSKHVDTGQMTLLNNPEEVAALLQSELQERVAAAGVEVIEARISYLAYATEIAAAMLQRQQADALVDAREVIVEGAVGIVDTAIQELERRNITQLNDEAKARLVSNMLVVLSSDQSAQSVVPVGAEDAKPSHHY